MEVSSAEKEYSLVRRRLTDCLGKNRHDYMDIEPSYGPHLPHALLSPFVCSHVFSQEKRKIDFKPFHFYSPALYHFKSSIKYTTKPSTIAPSVVRNPILDLHASNVGARRNLIELLRVADVLLRKFWRFTPVTHDQEGIRRTPLDSLVACLLLYRKLMPETQYMTQFM